MQNFCSSKCLVIFRDSLELTYGHDGKLRLDIRRVEIERALETHATSLGTTTTHPLKKSIHDVPERASTSADDDVDMQTALENIA
jgi:hypothetical protein